MYHHRPRLPGERVTRKEKRALILDLVHRWITPMHLATWEVKVRFPGRIKEIASCRTSPEYMCTELFFNLKRVPDIVTEIEELVAHEMCHPHIEALAELANKGARRTPERRDAILKAEERLTTTMSRILLPYLKALP